MREVLLDGVKVWATTIFHTAYRAAPCRFLLTITPENQNEMLDVFRRAGTFGEYSGLRISGIAEPKFLSEFPNLLYLELENHKRFNMQCLDGLTNLRGLRVESPGMGIDFSSFPELERFVGNWHPDNRNLHCCRELREARIWQFKPRSADLSAFAGATRLERLCLTQTSVSGLTGVEAMEDLRELTIAHAPKLVSLDALATGECGVRELSLSKAKVISDYRPIASVRRLRQLKLSSCAAMANLQWTHGMNSLDFFSFVETNVEDGDLSPLLDLTQLSYVGTLDKKHYSHKCGALNELLEKRRPESGI